MKFYFFTKGDKNVPSSRYRAYYVAESLVVLGHEAVVIPVLDNSFGSFFRYLRMLLVLSRKEVVYLQRPVLNTPFVLAAIIARFWGHHFVFDFDDAVYEHSFWQTMLLTRLADFVTCGSEKIQEWALQHNRHSYVLTNGVPLSIYTRRTSEPNGVPVIGWIGTSPHIYMQSAIPALHELAAQGRNFHLRIIGAMGNREIERLLAGIPDVTVIDALNWADPTEAVREIKSFTIGIMPLRSDPWDQVKYFKALEYMACSVPVVASSGETVQAIVTKSGSGLVASDTKEWVRHFSTLLDDASLRAEMGTKGRHAIEREYSTEVVAERLLAHVRMHQHPTRMKAILK
jgi:glycosyltransferase involved in cell wall biosynthesis